MLNVPPQSLGDVQSSWAGVFVIAIMVATRSLDAGAQDGLEIFQTEASRFCGVQACQTEDIYNVCEHRECGVMKSSKDCGQHWTRWHGCGGGHGNPCPDGCRRVGGALGYDYRSVGFPPRCQEKNKYQCEQDVERFASCEHPACGIKSQVQTGAVQFKRCAHPSHGLGEVENVSPALKELARAMAATYPEAAEAVGYDEEFEDAVRLTLAYIRDVAVKAPGATANQVKDLAQIFENKGRVVSVDDVATAVSAEVAVPLLVKLPELKLTCERQVQD